MTPSISCELAGRLSKSSNSTRMAASGTMAITSRDFPDTAANAPLMAVRRAWRLWMLAPFRLGVIAPAWSLRKVNSSSWAVFSRARAAITPSTVISQARRGRGLYCESRSIRLTGSLDERDLVDLLQRGDAGLDLGQRRFTEEPHTLFVGRPADFRRRPLFQNQFTDTVGKIKQFVDGSTAVVPSASALDASLSFIESDVS